MALGELAVRSATQSRKEKSIHQLVNLRVGAPYEGLGTSIHPGCTPLIMAVCHQDVEIARLLLKAGAQVNKACFQHGNPLHWAASRGHSDMIELLLQYGANPWARDGFLKTPGMVAAEQGHLEALMAMLMRGAEPDTVDTNGETAAHLAVKNKQTKVFLHLMGTPKYRASLGKENKFGNSVMVLAFFYLGDRLPMLLNAAPAHEAYHSGKRNLLNAAVVNAESTRLIVKMVLKRLPQDLLPMLLAH